MPDLTDLFPPFDPNAPLKGFAQDVSPQGLTAFIWVCFFIATLFVSLRMAVRWRQNHTFFVDDFWMGLAWLSMLTMTILQTVTSDSLWYITYIIAGRIDLRNGEEIGKNQIEFQRWQFPIIKLFWTTIWSVKASLLAVFYRLVKPKPVIRWFWFGVAIFTGLSYIASFLISALNCHSPGDYFKAGRCISEREVWMQRFSLIFSTSVDIASDLMIMALPLALLPSLQLDIRSKIGLGFAFSLGYIIIAVAIVRMSQLILTSPRDLVGLALWGAVETATALTIGSIIPLKGLLTRGINKIASSIRLGQGSGKSKDPESDPSSNGQGSAVRIVQGSEMIPLDGMHRSAQVNGGIYVEKTYATKVKSKEVEDEEAAFYFSK